VLTLVTALMAVAGCTHGNNHPAATSTTTSAAPAPNPGNYPTKPHPMGASGSPAIGAVTEARRMGDNVILPYQVDPVLTKSGIREGPFTDLTMLASWFDKPIFEPLANHHFLAGFLASHSTGAPGTLGQPRDKELMNGVLRFASDTDASAAVADMAANSVVLQPLLPENPPRPTTRVTVARHPETAAFAHSEPYGGAIEQAYTAHGPYVLVQWATTAAGPQPTNDLIATALDQQLPLIDAFVPTPEDQLAALPRDPSGVFAHTLPPDKDPAHAPGDYGPHATLTFMMDPARDQKLFETTGVDVVAMSKTNVFRARDAAAAGAVAADFISEMREHKMLASPPIPAITGSQCLTEKPGTDPLKPNARYFYCTFSTGRYAVEVQGPQRGDVEQAAAAQYLMLTAP
jgi:hypothetical protein